jgi:cell division septation protein DedD
MQDEGLHEIQLNGKQLVFLFMAATVVAVVIFLCGVMVGRGVPVRAGGFDSLPGQVLLDPTALPHEPAPASASPTTTAIPLSAQETLTYPERLEEPTPPVETLRVPVEMAVAPLAPSSEADPTVEAVPAAAAAPALNGADDAGFVVQVAAVRERSEADTIARRLNTKGYPAFVTTPPNGAPVFRVRVGKYSDRRDAESVAGRLEKEEQFKPWITR